MRGRGSWADAWTRLKRDRVAFASAALLAALAAGAVGADQLAPYPYDRQDAEHMLEGPSRLHLLGTDRLGRDLLSRLLVGTRMSMAVGVVTALGALLVGTAYGAVSGYVGGRLDEVLMRFVDVVYSLPDLLVIILITVAIGRGPLGIFLALSLVGWVSVARLVRGMTLKLSEEPFVEAARALGASLPRILARHVVPNLAGPILVTLTYRIPASILSESTLSFLGLGIAPPFSSWGTLVDEGWRTMRAGPHLLLFPSLVLFSTVLAFNLLGDGLRDALDPRMRGPLGR